MTQADWKLDVTAYDAHLSLERIELDNHARKEQSGTA